MRHATLKRVRGSQRRVERGRSLGHGMVSGPGGMGIITRSKARSRRRRLGSG